MKVALYFTLACTAKCAHCITFAAPRVGRKMPFERARALLHQVRATAGFDGVVFTGGENFIHRNELLALVRECTRLDLKSEIITNAYWATSPTVARDVLAPFQDAGLHSLRISVDEYHLPYVPVDRVHCALAGMAALGLVRQITCVVPHRNTRYRIDKLDETMRAIGFEVDQWDPPAVERLASAMRATWPPDLLQLLTDQYRLAATDLFLVDDVVTLRDGGLGEGAARLVDYLAASKVLVQYQTLATEGRGRDLMDSVELKHVDDTADAVCNSVGLTPTVSPEGNVFPCCSSWVNVPALSEGNVADVPFATLMERVKRDPIALFMHHQGPRALVKYLRDQNADLPADYSHPCHLCGTLLERYSRAQLTEHIEEFYADQPWRLLFTTRGFRPEATALTPFLPVACERPRAMPLATARRFFGLLDPTGRHRGFHIEGSAGDLVRAFRVAGQPVVLGPIEDGPPAAPHLGILRTWGSPWVELLDPPGGGILDEAAVCELSVRLGCRALTYDYQFDTGVFHHCLYAGGRVVEWLQATTAPDAAGVVFASERPGAPSAAEVEADPAGYVRRFASELRIRDWSISLAELGRREMPFPPTLIVESFFLRLSQGVPAGAR